MRLLPADDAAVFRSADAEKRSVLVAFRHGDVSVCIELDRAELDGLYSAILRHIEAAEQGIPGTGPLVSSFGEVVH